MYRIIQITDTHGNNRTDGRYPKRVGSVVDILHSRLNCHAGLMYIEDNNGNSKDGVLWTSPVRKKTEHEKLLIIETQNSIYTFEKINEQK